MLRKKLFQSTEPEKNDNYNTTDLLDLSLENCPAEDISKYFPNIRQHSQTTDSLVNQLLHIQRQLNISLNKVNFLKPPIKYIYNPTEYAKEPFEMYFKKYCTTVKKLLFVGMNPGPFGMCQTGVPFGDTVWVKNWLQIQGNVSKPSQECPRRQIYGFECTRKEQSGDRFWKFWFDTCSTPEKFFSNAFVYNYCPLAFMDQYGKNLTPVDIKDCRELESICDKYYMETISALQPQIVICIGRYTERRTKLIFKCTKLNINVLFMPHPSPRSVGNRNWTEKAENFLRDNNLLQFFQ